MTAEKLKAADLFKCVWSFSGQQTPKSWKFYLQQNMLEFISSS